MPNQWKMKDGKTINIEEMENDHLISTIKMMAGLPNPSKNQQSIINRLQHECDMRKLDWTSADHIKMQTKVWIDARGKLHRICDMVDNHLKGTLKVLKRAAVIQRALKIVSLLDETDLEGITDLGYLPEVVKSQWREHVPMRDMFESMEKDWKRRGLGQWDEDPEETIDQIKDDAMKVMKKLQVRHKPAFEGSRAPRSIRI